MSKIEVRNLSLIFGANRKQAQKMLEQGKTKQEIHKKTKCTVAVHDASFDIQEGEIFVIIGLSGSGKSSLLRCFNMLNVPTSGSLKIDGEDITKLNKSGLLNVRRKKVSMVFQHFGLLPHRTILENVAFGLEIQGLSKESREAKAKEIINMVGLKDYGSSFPHQLSGGMQQRVGIARALATDTDILLMDEAFSALDPLIRTQMQDELLMVQEKLKKTIIFITHDLDEAIKLGSTIAIMKDGQIVQLGQAEDILLNPANDYVKAFVENVDRSKIITASSVMEPFKSRVHLSKEGPAGILRQMERALIRILPVVDSGNVFQGYVREKDVRKMLENKNTNLHSILIDVPRVHEDMNVSDMLPLFINQKYPLVVVDKEDHPLGFIRHSDVVAMVTGFDDDEVQNIIEQAAN